MVHTLYTRIRNMDSVGLSDDQLPAAHKNIADFSAIFSLPLWPSIRVKLISGLRAEGLAIYYALQHDLYRFQSLS